MSKISATDQTNQSSRLARLRSRLGNRIRAVLGLLGLSVRRLLHYRGLSVLALVGIVLAVALVTSNAFFAQGVDRVMMQRELTEYFRITGHPAFSSRIFASSSRTVPLSLQRAEQLGVHIADTISSEVGLPVKKQGLLVDSGMFALDAPADSQLFGEDDQNLERVRVSYVADIVDHITISQGDAWSEKPTVDGLPVWMNAVMAEELGVNAGDSFSLKRDDVEGVIPITIVGLWSPADPDSEFWPRDPEKTMVDSLLAHRDDYINLLEPLLPVKVRTATWQVTLNEARAVPAQARHYKEGFEKAATILPRYIPDARLTAATNAFEKFVGHQTTLTTLLMGFNIPALGFLIYFLVLTSAVIAYWQRRETAQLRSRGVSRSTVLNFTVTEQALLFFIGVPLGWILGLVLARLMGYAVSFLSFEMGSPLPVAMNAMGLRLTILTLGVVLLAKLWTVASSSNQTVVTQEREHARPTKGPFWYRYYLDLILILPTWYAYRQLVHAGWLGALVQDKPGDLYQDPLLVILPSLFIITASLVLMRLFPLLMRLLDSVAGLLPNFASYLALRQLSRQSTNYINPLLLVIISLALGVYTVSMAASMDQWLKDRVFYSVGADLAITPYTEALGVGGDWIPPVDEFEALPGVHAAARVGDYTTEIIPSGSQGPSYDGRFIGVDRIDLPDAVWYRDDLSRESLGALLNRLAQLPDGVLISQQMMDDNNLRVGDKIHLIIIPEAGSSIRDQFTVVGAYENFPTVYPEEPAVIGNLEYVFSYFGLTLLHDIWMDLDEGVTGEQALAEIDTLGIDVVNRRYASRILADEQAVMERVGVFGTLSISFIAAAVMAAVGLLTYSYASLNERLFQFSVLRAVGLRRSQIIGQVALEYGILTTFGAIMGVLAGTLAADAVCAVIPRVQRAKRSATATYTHHCAESDHHARSAVLQPDDPAGNHRHIFSIPRQSLPYIAPGPHSIMATGCLGGACEFEHKRMHNH